jgi:hypothetical protein
MKLKRLVLAAAFLFAPLVAHAQTAVVTNPPVVANDCPGFTDTYGTVADSGIYCSGGVLKVLQGAAPGIGFFPAYPSSTDTMLGVGSGGKLVLSRQSVFGSGTTATDYADMDFERTANYTGGTSGYVQGNVRVHDMVSAGTKDYEWATTCVLENSATSTDASQNVCLYGQSHKKGTGATWAGVLELQDYAANPTTSSVTDEHDLTVVGTDSNNMRVIGDWFCKSKDGNPATCAAGMRIHADTNATIGTGIALTGAVGTGIDLSQASYLAGNALVIGDTNHLCLDTLCQKYLMHNGLLAYDVGGSNVWTVSDTGQITATSLTVSGNVSTTAGNVVISAGKELQLDGAGNAGTFYYDSASGTTRLYSAVNGDVWKTDGAGNVTLKGNLTSTGGDLIEPAGKLLCLDGGCTLSWFTYDSASGQERIANPVNGTVFYVDGGGAGWFKNGITGASLTVGSGAISGGAITGTSLGLGTGSITSGAITSSGTVQGATVTSTGNINATSGTLTAAHVTSNNEVTASTNLIMPTNGKVCLNGAACTISITYDGTYIRFLNASGASMGAINMSTGVYGSYAGYNSGLSVGVSCSGAPTASFAVSGGIVTHC